MVFYIIERLVELRDYGQDLDALLIAKPATMKVEMTAMWQDNVGRALIKSSAPASGTDDAGDIDEAEDASPILIVFFGGLLFTIPTHTPLTLTHLFDCKLIEEKLAQATYSLDCVNLAADFKAAVAYNLRCNKLESNKHVTEAQTCSLSTFMLCFNQLWNISHTISTWA